MIKQVVAVATYCAILVPRAHLLAEAMTQGMFMASMYQLFCLFMAYCGGEANLIASVKPQSLDMQVPPCCCWPCCCCLPKFTLTKYDFKLKWLLSVIYLYSSKSIPRLKGKALLLGTKRYTYIFSMHNLYVLFCIEN